MKVHLRVVEGPDAGRAFTFETRDRFLIGRAPTAHFQITQDNYFSRHHMMLEVNPPNVMLQDLQSTNGTVVNSAGKIKGAVNLADGDTIGGGKTRIKLTIEDDAILATELPRAPSTPVRPSQPITVPNRTSEKVAVQCLRCGARAANELPRSRAENMAYFCDTCQAALVEEPKLVPGYQVVRRLGNGAMGAVYLAVQTAVSRPVAIKMILPRAAMSQKIRDMFLREAKEHARLDHPRVVRLFDLQESAPGIFCMVMEYVEGHDAGELLKDSPGGIDPKLAVEVISQALEGLQHAHDHGIVHRDIKDANLLVGRDKRGNVAVKLSDFGLAKSYETSGASGFTSTGTIAGTVPYMAPEQILDFKNVKPAADLYSMGATLYHLLTGQLAYDFGREIDPLVMILEKDIVPLQKRKPSIPAALAQVVERSLKKDPKQRHRDADEMRQALRAACP
jgi:serine/threonine-protein kinase